jgi:hypothetical protein
VITLYRIAINSQRNGSLLSRCGSTSPTIPSPIIPNVLPSCSK